jgi:peptide/nickel transport system permease protein
MPNQPRAPDDACDDSSTSRARYLLRRTAVLLFAVWLAATLVFTVVHLGPRTPGDATITTADAEVPPEEPAALADRQAEFGLNRPLSVQYVDYLGDLSTLDFGRAWTTTYLDGATRAQQFPGPPRDVSDLVFGERMWRTLWLWAMTAAVTLVGGGFLAVASLASPRTPDLPGATVTGAMLRALPVLVLTPLVKPVLWHSQELLLGFDWSTFLVQSSSVYMIQPPTDVGSFSAVKFAVKNTLPLAVVMSMALLPAGVRVWRWTLRNATDAPWLEGARARGVGKRTRVGRGLRGSARPVVSLFSFNVAVLMGATLLVDTIARVDGLGQLFVEAVAYGDYTTVQAMLFLTILALAAARLVEDVLYVGLADAPETREERAADYWTGDAGATRRWRPAAAVGDRLRALPSRTPDRLLSRVRGRPVPAVVWVTAGLLLFALEAGALLSTIEGLPLTPGLPDLPTLLNRQTIPNDGVWRQGQGWTETAFGLPPAIAWGLRVGLVYAYAIAWAAWLWVGYRVYRSVYREAEWTPLDATLARLRSNPWAMFGACVVFVFFVAAVFESTLVSVVPGDGMVTHYSEQAGRVTQTNLDHVRDMSRSNGNPETNVGPLSYDRFGRFHPFGSAVWGHSVFARFPYLARVIFVAGGIGAAVAVGLAALTATVVRRRRLAGGAASLVAESVTVLPTLPFAFFVIDTLQPTWNSLPKGAHSLSGGGKWLSVIALAVLLGVLLWPAVWRTIHAQFEAADAGWTTAARGFGESPRAAFGRHSLPRLAGHLVSYSLLAFVGVVIATASVASLWVGSTGYLPHVMYSLIIGRGPPHLTNVSWHTAVIPAAVNVLVLLGFLALADGVRSATDPDGEDGVAAPGEAAAAGGVG